MKITKANASPRTNARNAFAAALTAACLGLAAAVSHAADTSPGVEPAKKVVQYGDLNLSNPAGIERLYQRIVFAAQQVCDDRTGPRPLEEQIRTKICINQSVERAITAVNQPALTMLYAAKTGRAPAPSAVLANRH
jgi:UrcA family protein